MSYLSLSLLPTPLPHNKFNFVFSLLEPLASVSLGQGREDEVAWGAGCLDLQAGAD